MEDSRIDESDGSLFDQAVRSAMRGYGDRDYLRSQARVARSPEVGSEMRSMAMGNVVRIVQTYGTEKLARLLTESIDGTTD